MEYLWNAPPLHRHVIRYNTGALSDTHAGVPARMLENSQIEEQCRRLARAAAGVSALVGALVLLAWASGFELPKSLIPGLPAMPPATALCFMLAGWILHVRAGTHDHPQPADGWAVSVAIGILALIAATSLVKGLLGDTGPLLMSIAAAVALLLIAASLAALPARAHWVRCTAEACAMFALLIGLVGLAGYHFGATGLYHTGPFASLALHTAALFVALPIGILASRRDGTLCSVVADTHAGGLVARRLIPLAIALPLLTVWLRSKGEDAGLFAPEFGDALVTTAMIAMFCAVILFMANGLNRLGASRARTSELLGIQNRALERVARGVPLGASLDALLRDVEERNPEMLTSILLVDDEGMRVRHGAAPRLPAQYVAAIDGLPIGPAAGSCGTAAWRREQVVVEDIATDPLWEQYRGLAARHGLAACWSTPIFGVHGSLLATFAIYYTTVKRPDPSHAAVIDRVIQTVAIAIGAARITQALHQGKAELEAAQLRGNLGSFELDTGATRGRWSRQMYRIFGRDPAQPAPNLEELLEYIHPGDREALVGALRHPEGNRQLDFRIVDAAGRERTLSGNIESTRDTAGNPVTMAGTVIDITQRKEAERALQRTLGHARDLSRRLGEAEEEERRNIGREIHDRLGTDLAAAKLNLDLLGSELHEGTSATIRRRLAEARELVQNAIDHSRNILAELRPPGLDDGGLLLALTIHAEAVERRVGIPVTVSGEKIDPPLPLVETALFRIAQEALSNISRHAGANAVEVTIEQADGTLRMKISDDGCGFDPAAKPAAGYGLRTMRERAEAVDASFDITSAPGAGTTVTITVERAAWH